MASSDAGVAARAIPLGPDDPPRLGAYTLLGKLGQGGMGTVYLGRSEKGRLVAIKVIRTEAVGNPEFRARFRLEAETARRVARVCTAEVLDADPDAEWPYLVTEFIEGETLARYVQRNGPLADANLEQLAVGVAAALTAIHSAGIVHRDLKPANVILSPFGPRVIDFGIARTVDAGSGLTGDLQQLGTPAFMSPEQIESRPISSAVDIWAWGGLVAFAATGHYPFGEASAQVLLYRALHEEPRLDDVDPALRPIVWLAMRKDPAGRPSAQQLMLRLLGDPASSNPDAAAAVNPEDVTNVLQGWQLPSPAAGTQPNATGPGGGYTLGPDDPTRLPSGTGGPSTAGYTADQDAPTRLPTGTGTGAGGGYATGGARGFGGPGGPQDPGYPQGAPGAGGTFGAGGSGGPGDTRPAPDEKRRSRGRSRAPLLVGGGVVVVGAIIATILALGGGGKDDNTATAGAGSTPGASATAPAGSAAFPLPKSATALSDATMVYTAQKNGSYDLFSATVGPAGLLTGQKQITSTPAKEILPVISIDRQTVVYSVESANRTQYMAIAADGSGKAVPLLASGAAKNLTIPGDSRASLSPDGGSMVTRSLTDDKGTAASGLYIVNLKTQGVTRIKNAAEQATDPAWSPSGDRIAYWSILGGGQRGFIVTIPVTEGAQPDKLTLNQGNDDTDPAWSPDGSKIAFTRKQNGDLEIFEMDSDGKNITQLTRARGDDMDPTFGPKDDPRIIFSSNRGDDRKQLRILDPNNPTASDHPLTEDRFLSAHPRWNSG
ncbi:protein kinase domain-containing protein [Frankia canadensis]|nr:protein kinase [Frankia canadensis]